MAPGTAPPEASVTVPRIVPRNVCASHFATPNTSIANKDVNTIRLRTDLLILSLLRNSNGIPGPGMFGRSPRKASGGTCKRFEEHTHQRAQNQALPTSQFLFELRAECEYPPRVPGLRSLLPCRYGTLEV